MRKNEARLNLIVGSFVLGMGALLVVSIFVIGQGKGTWKEKATIAADFRQVSAEGLPAPACARARCDSNQEKSSSAED